MKCEECGVSGTHVGICEDCCDHSDICRDERLCLICGKDLTEEFICDAEARADLDAGR